MAQTPPSIVRRVTQAELCRIFNDGQYAERAARGEYRMVVKKSRVTKMDYIQNWVPGTESQELHILDAEGSLLVKAHRFLRPDNKLAASGKIDPKRIFLNGEWYGLLSPDRPDEP